MDRLNYVRQNENIIVKTKKTKKNVFYQRRPNGLDDIQKEMEKKPEVTIHAIEEDLDEEQNLGRQNFDLGRPNFDLGRQNFDLWRPNFDLDAEFWFRRRILILGARILI